MIKLICVGKIKETFFEDAIREYKKRLNRYTKLDIIEVEDVRGNNPSIIKAKEGEFIQRHIEIKDYVITLEIEGINFTSEAFSERLEKLQMENVNIVFIIGGSYGLDEKIKNRSNLAISFSKLTFPHQLFRIIFLEQLYRAYKIINNETYHK